MMKLTVLYGHPESADAFERYYAETHLPLVDRMQGVAEVSLTRFLAAPDGGAPAYYRMAVLSFADQQQMDCALSSEEGQAAVADLTNFATGGVTVGHL